jgi:hypothetical protein
MTIKEHAQSLLQSDEKLIEISPFCYMRLMPDGSAILHKTTVVGWQEILLSRHDLEFIKNIALPLRIFTPGPESEKDVHTEHCCVIHGCKYGSANCPVEAKTKNQSHACESCYMDAAEGFSAQEEHPYCEWRDAHEN